MYLMLERMYYHAHKSLQTVAIIQLSSAHAILFDLENPPKGGVAVS